MMLRRPTDLARRTRRGMVTAQVALSMGVLMAVLALVTDGGILLVERRHAQATADAAALAAASDIYANGGSTDTASASALGVASSNGSTCSACHDGLALRSANPKHVSRQSGHSTWQSFSC